jgi:hypothetical protein
MTEKKPAPLQGLAINSQQSGGGASLGAPKAPGASVQPRAPAETGTAAPPPMPRKK